MSFLSFSKPFNSHVKKKVYVKSCLFLYCRFASLVIHKKQRVGYKEIHMNNVKWVSLRVYVYACECTQVCVCACI